jgi:hypothetical protein
VAAATLTIAGSPPAGAAAGAPPVVTDTVVDLPPADVSPPVATDTVVDFPPADVPPPVATDTVVDFPPADVAPPAVVPPPAPLVAAAENPASARAQLVELAEREGVALTEELLAVLLVLE